MTNMRLVPWVALVSCAHSVGPRARPLARATGAASVCIHTVGPRKRQVVGGLLMPGSTPEAVWSVLTDYERLPDIIPSIVAHNVTRAPTGDVWIDQDARLSSTAGLTTRMRLRATEDRASGRVALRRVEGKELLEFECHYAIEERPGGTYVRYCSRLRPCSLYPLSLVEYKLRKEVPEMLRAIAEASREVSLGRGS